MEKIYWSKLNWFKKIIFSFGWLSVLNLGFWIALIIYANYTQEDKFWTAGSFRVVYVFGWINFISILFVLVLGIFLPL